MAIALHHREQLVCRIGGSMTLDWLVLILALVATSLRLAVRTNLDPVGTDDEHELLPLSRSSQERRLNDSHSAGRLAL